MKKRSKWICALLSSVFVLSCTAAIASCNPDVSSSGGSSSDNSSGSSSEEPSVKTEGVESGVYYFEEDGKESLLSLYNGDSFTLNQGDEVLYGTYTVTDGAVSFTWAKANSDKLAATYADDVLTVVYNGATKVYLRKKSYTVTYNTDGGSAVESETVVNGKTVAKPADPVKAGYAFVGWYTDASYSEPFLFGTKAVTGDTTIYAQWAKKSAGQAEYTVTLDANYEGAETQTAETVGGKLYDVATPTREGYTFVGWYVSQYNDPEKLSYQYTSGMTFTEDMTLFAVWSEKTTGDKLSAPVANIGENSLSWTAVGNATAYRVVIASGDQTIVDETIGTNRYAFSFAGYAAGDYTVSVTAIAASSANNSDPAVLYYKNKALAKVSHFNVIDGKTLLFEGVDNAERYYITVVCGNAKHKHENFDNGSSTTFDFSNCDMQEGGIQFTVTAVASGYASSSSYTYTYNRTLSAVQNLTFDEDSQLLVWDDVAGATEYIVSIGNGEEEYITESVGTKHTYSLKKYTGDIIVNVYPKTKGYNSPAATTLTVNKTMLATPDNIKVTGSVLSWDEVDGATGYEVKIGDETIQTTAAQANGADFANWGKSDSAAVSVRALGTENSAWSDKVVISYAALDNIAYHNGTLTWTSVAGAEKYQVKVNDEAVTDVVGENQAKVTLTQAGNNTLYVRYYDGTNYSAWTSTTVYAHTIYFNTASGDSLLPVYRATGDKLELPDATRAGYQFAGWYNTLGGSKNNGAAYDNDELYAVSGDIVVYATWAAKQYQVTYDERGGETETASTSVEFGTKAQFAVPTNSDTRLIFAGWYSHPNGLGKRYSDMNGNATAAWDIAEDTTLYAYWYQAFSFTERNDGTYAVTGGADIRTTELTHITVPSSYKGVAVTLVDAYAFRRCTNLRSIDIPDTITTVESTAFYSCSKLQAVNVYSTGVKEVFYKSFDGVLIYNDPMEQAWEIVYYPAAREGEYVIPDYVSVIPLKAFSGSLITKVTIPYTITRVGANAFFNCQKLTEVVFGSTPAGVEALPLTIQESAFSGCLSLTDITLPARLSDFGTAVFDVCTSIQNITVEEGNTRYTSVEGYLCSADGRTLVYAPKGKSGVITIPSGVDIIGESAFSGCTNITEVVIPFYVTEIQKNAFSGCSKLVALTVEGGSMGTLTIGESAFADCKLKTANFASDCTLTSIDAAAFAGQYLTTLELPASISYIGATAFSGNDSLQTVKIADGGKDELTIDARAFYRCGKLVGVTLPDTLTSLASTAFADCVKLSDIYVSANNQTYTSVDGVLYTKDVTALVYYAQGRSGEYIVPNTVTTIKSYAFSDCTGLTKIVIPASVTSIGQYAFNGCNSLATVSIALDAEELTIEQHAFDGASALDEVTLPDCVTAIGDYVFANTSHLRTVVMNNVTEIDNYAFQNSAITSVDFTKITSIGKYAFADSLLAGKISLANDVTVGDYAFKSSAVTEVVIKSGQTFGHHAFAYCSAVEKVTIEDGVESLPANIFYYATKLSSVTIPASVTSIGNYAFSFCTHLSELTFAAAAEGEEEKDLVISARAFDYTGSAVTDGYTTTLPARTKEIGDYAFNNSRLAGKVVIPANVGKLGTNTFNNMKYITEVEIEGGDKELAIPNGIFYGASALTKVVLPERIISIGGNAFYNCTALTELQLPKTLKTVTSTAFTGCKNLSLSMAGTSDYFEVYQGVLYGLTNGNKTSIVYCNANVAENLIIPKTITSIPDSMFTGKDNLKTVDYEDGRTAKLSVGKNAFNNCAALTSIRLPVLSSLGQYALANNKALTSVTLEDGGTSDSLTFGNNLFNNDSALTEIVIPAYVTGLGYYTFQNTTALKDVTFAEGSRLTGKLYGATFNNTAIEKIVIPDGVTGLTGSTFSGNKALKSVTLPANLASGVTGLYGIFTGSDDLAELYIGEDALNYTVKDNALYSKDGTTLIWVLPAATEKFTIAEGTTAIGEKAFNYAGAASVVIPESVVKIGNYAFQNSKLQTLEISEEGDELNVGTYAFASSLLQKVSIPTRVNLNSASYAFTLCSSLEEVTFADNGKTTTIPSNCFYNSTKLTKVTLPQGLTQIKEAAFKSTSIAEITIPKTVVSVVGTQYNYSFSGNVLTKVVFEEGSQCTTLQYAFNCANLKTVDLKSDVLTSIGAYAFNGCSSLEKLALPSTLTTIATYAFYNCESLTDLSIPDSVKTIGTYAFYNCKGITSVVIPSNVTTIGNYTFYGCSSLTSVTIPSSVTTIGSYTFASCDALTSITIPEGVKSLGAYVFLSDSSLSSITLPENSLTTIGTGAFVKTALTSMKLPNSITTLGSSLFANNTQLLDATLPSSLTEISTSTFSGCTALTAVHSNGKITSIAGSAFSGCTSLTTVPFASTLQKIGTTAFNGCTGLTDTGELEVLTSIGASAFSGCSALEKVRLNEGLTTINSTAFQNCTSLPEIYIPASVTTIGNGPFTGCTSLAVIEVDPGNTSYVTVDSVLYNAALTNLVAYPTMATGDVVVPASVTSISASAFEGSNVSSVVFEGVVQTISLKAFANCANLTSVILPSGVMTIGNYAFYNSAITKIEIPNTVTSIGAYAFRDTQLKELTFEKGGSKLLQINNAAFRNTQIETLEIPLRLRITTGGNGYAYYDFGYAIQPYAFADNPKLTTITYEEGEKFAVNAIFSIGEYAFANCTALKSVYFTKELDNLRTINEDSEIGTDELSAIGEYAFSGCTALESVVFEEDLSRVGATGRASVAQYAFANCTSLKTVQFADYIELYTRHGDPDWSDEGANGLFMGCTALESITLPAVNTLSTIPQYMFKNCTALKEVNGSFTYVGVGGFEGCTALTTINNPTQMRGLSKEAFKGCTSLNLTIESTYIYISQGSFSGWTADQTITFTEYSGPTTTFYTGWNDDCEAVIVWKTVGEE